MLEGIKNDIKKNYFDPSFRGIDLEAKYKEAAAKIENATSIGQMNGIIAQFLLNFDDSHLFFIPPGKASKTDYGFAYEMIGDKCFITSIDAKSDAAKKGLQIGDEIYSFAGYAPMRENLWKIRYFFNRLVPQPILDMAIIKPDGKEVIYKIESKITTGKRIMDLTGGDINQIIRESEDQDRKESKQYFHEKTNGLFIWKMPSFSLEPSKVDDIMDKADKAQGMILDLRGNGGGRVDMVLRLIGNFFTEDVKVADEKTRKKTKEIIAKSRGKNSYAGKLVVLIDAGSGSASEVFSKVIQFEKRGTVIGDRSAGAVMESMYFGRQVGMDVVVFYGASITIADLIMKDGKSLEKIGVTPDEKLLPTGKDLAAKRDPVLSRAAEILGFKMSPEEAGKLFQIEYDN
jgi:C-terminal processing protease CtpA/Prc